MTMAARVAMTPTTTSISTSVKPRLYFQSVISHAACVRGSVLSSSEVADIVARAVPPAGPRRDQDIGVRPAGPGTSLHLRIPDVLVEIGIAGEIGMVTRKCRRQRMDPAHADRCGPIRASAQ